MRLDVGAVGIWGSCGAGRSDSRCRAAPSGSVRGVHELERTFYAGLEPRELAPELLRKLAVLIDALALVDAP